MGAGKHAGDLLAALVLAQLRYVGHGRLAVARLGDAEMVVRARGDLRGVRDDQKLASLGQAGKAVADGRRRGAADAAVDLVEHQAALRADLGEHNLERQQEARQLAAGGDLVERPRIGAGVGGDLEGHPLDPVGTPVVLRLERLQAGLERRLLELERRQFGVDRGVQPAGCLAARLGQRLGVLVKGLARLLGLVGEVLQVLAAAVDRVQALLQAGVHLGQGVHLAAVLAGEVLEREVALLDLLLAAAVEIDLRGERAQAGERVLGLRHRSVEGVERGGDVFPAVVGDPFQRAPGARQAVLGAAGLLAAGQFRLRGVEGVDQLLRVHQAVALVGELLFLAGLRLQLVQLVDLVAKISLVLLRPLQLRLGGAVGLQRLPPGVVALGDLPGACLQPAVGVQQAAVVRLVEQAALLELPLDFHQMVGQPAQQRDRDRLVVDVGAAAPVLRQHPAHHQLVVLDLDVVLVQNCAHWMAFGDVEGGRDLGLIGAGAQQPAVRPVAERQAERIQQDRLAGTGLAGQRAQARGEFQLKPVDQNDVADRETAQHTRGRQLTESQTREIQESASRSGVTSRPVSSL